MAHWKTLGGRKVVDLPFNRQLAQAKLMLNALKATLKVVLYLLNLINVISSVYFHLKMS